AFRLRIYFVPRLLLQALRKHELRFPIWDTFGHKIQVIIFIHHDRFGMKPHRRGHKEIAASERSGDDLHATASAWNTDSRPCATAHAGTSKARQSRVIPEFW